MMEMERAGSENRFKVVEVREADQIRIECSAAPDADERVVLKGNGFRMLRHDPMVWWRFLTESARKSAARACKELNR